MRAPLSWLAEHADIGDTPAPVLARALTRIGIKVERVVPVGRDINGVVVGRVLEIEELTGLKKPVRFCQVEDGSGQRGVICGATNFSVGDVVPFARPGAVLPGGVHIEVREAYRRRSEGMICSARELGLGEDHTGILVLSGGLPPGADVVEALHLADDVLEVEVSPDRGYCLSVRGLAREVAAALDVGYRDPAASVAGPVAAGGYPVHVEDYLGCDRYVAATVRGLDPAAATPPWLGRRLTLCGMRTVSLPVDVTNYVMLELGQPLHAFDADRLTGPISVRRATAGERLTTLDGVTRDLHPDDLVIADRSGPVALAGVLGGGPTEVSAGTTALVIESAHFDPGSITRTARRHRLASEAARRYERGVDDAVAPAAAARAGSLLAQFGGAVPEAAVTDVDGRPGPVSLSLPTALPGRLAGLPYPPGNVRRRLVQVGCGVTGEDPLAVVPPSWRPDLRRPVDLVEEVVRLEGWDALPATLPPAPPGRGLTPDQRRRRAVGRALAAAGCVEVRPAPFVAASVGDTLLLAPADPGRPTVALANPLSAEQPMLRASLLPGLFDALLRNIGRGFRDLALYEIGQVFRARPGGPEVAPPLGVSHRPSDAELAGQLDVLPEQPVMVGAVLAGDRRPAGWWGSAEPASWTDAVDLAHTVAGAVGAGLATRAAQVPPWHPGRCAALVLVPEPPAGTAPWQDGTVVGHAGELHPRVVEAFGLPARSCAVELALGPLLAAAVDPVPAPTLSGYPPASLDVALIVDAATPAADVAAALSEGAGPLLEDLRLFDVYTGPQAGAEGKSLAFSLRLRAVDHTLTAEESLAIRDAAVAEAARRLGARLRG
jgi:phenylalanyl-tRNA synthetase beta chain